MMRNMLADVLPEEETIFILMHTFRSIVVLPKDTNQTLTFEVEREGENQLLMAQNKWLIAHEEAGIEGAFCRLQGENITFL